MYLIGEGEESERLRNNLKLLLHSSDLANVQTAVQVLRGAGLPPQLVDDLMFAYLVCSDLEVRADIRRVFFDSPQIDDFSKRYFKAYLEEPWIMLSGSEQTIRRRLLKYFPRKGLIFKPLKIAKTLYQTHRRGYCYILEKGDAADRMEFLEQAFHWGHLNLSGLNDLFRLPDELRRLPDLQTLDLRRCGFRVFPKLLLRSEDFPQLYRIDLRGNPLRELSSAVIQRLASRCEVLI